MKNRIKQNLNQDTKTKILDFDGGNGASIPMLLALMLRRWVFVAKGRAVKLAGEVINEMVR